jgi:hypothetical protein
MRDSGDERTKDEFMTEPDDYLWNRSGTPDGEIQELEGLLAKFRHDRPTPEFPEISSDRIWRIFPKRIRLFPALAALGAAAVLAFVIFLAYRREPMRTDVAGWDVSGVVGSARIGANAVVGKATRRLGVGQVLQTDSEAHARLNAGDVGQIEVEADTRLRLLAMKSGLQRIALDRGTIRAFIWAPAGEFVVDTPSATTVDLGCAYTLKVDETGAGLVRTSMGWVGFKLNGRESFIPAGAACATRPKVGPGTPYFEDASARLREALARFDFEDTTAPQRAQDVATVVRESRKRDALTLWHLLSRVDEEQRGLVYDRLRKFVPHPASVTRDGILRLDQPMLDAWWNALGFDDIAVWRRWEKTAPSDDSKAREK